MKTGIELIAEERREQLEKHFNTVASDQENNTNEELRKAAIYALTMSRDSYPDTWNFWFHDKLKSKQSRMSDHDFYIEQLKIAGALIAAEIDRIKED